MGQMPGREHSRACGIETYSVLERALRDPQGAVAAAGLRIGFSRAKVKPVFEATSKQRAPSKQRARPNADAISVTRYAIE